ncbi:MAG: hypothetical protein QNJ81_03235 [Acidimicrobiia bacterium]|nr:hypothetical protein [Acidimicrobiia bacterium]
MIALRTLVFLLGVAIALWTVMSALRTTVLPRSAQVGITRFVFRGMRWIFFQVLAGPSRSFATRDRILALYGPVSLLALPIVWLILIDFAYSLMFWALEPGSFMDATSLSGSSITTLGFTPAATGVQRILAFTEAGWGLILVTLMITYLPSIYSTFARRETQVSLLEVRAGDPPSAVVMLSRYHRIGWLDNATETWLDWERWFAEIEESHTTFPILPFFRSPQPQRSWVTASGTVLDAAAIYLSCIEGVQQGPAGVCIRSGFLTLRRLADFFGIEFDPDPAPDDPISISRAEFDDAWRRLDEEGIALKDDQDQAWRDFAGWRVNYDTVLLALAEVTVAPYAPWSSDRSSPSHEEPKVSRFGRRVRSKVKGGRSERSRVDAS